MFPLSNEAIEIILAKEYSQISLENLSHYVY